MAFDVFGDAATRGYLRNIAGTNDMRLVKILEQHAFLDNIDKALCDLSKATQISYADVLKTHKTLFECVYPWAGEDRRKHAPDIAITKGGKDMFAYPRDVQGAMEYGLRQGQDKAYMASRPGDVMGTLAYSHPFLDGNGRTIMTVHAELAHRAGIRVEWEKTSKTDYLSALTCELENPGKGELDAYLRPYVQKATDRQAMAETLKELPGLGPMPQPAPSTQTAKPEAPPGKSEKAPEASSEGSGQALSPEMPKPPEGDKPKGRQHIR